MELVTLKQLFQRLNGGRLLGLDVGSRNIGVAVSDPHCRIASPHSVLYWTQSTVLKNISWLESLVQELSITGFVIGYPLELTGFQGKQVVFSFCNLMHITLGFVDITTQVVFPILLFLIFLPL
jgi:RNase H-fold protein (predicted Holliday junction resolvase)